MVYRTALVDEEAGIVLLRMNFGQGSAMGSSDVLDVFEAFKIYNDTMHVVMAFMQKVPDIADRTPEKLFGWNYDTDVTSIAENSRMTRYSYSLTSNDYRNGVSKTLSPSPMLIFDIIDLSGRIVYSHTSDGSGKSVLFLPLKGISAGKYLGRLRYYEGREATRTFHCNVNIIE